MCHRRKFLQWIAGGAGLLIVGQSAEAAKTTKSTTASAKKPPKAAKKPKAGKEPKTAWYAKIYLPNGGKFVGPFPTHNEAMMQGNLWVSKNGKGASFRGETVSKSVD